MQARPPVRYAKSGAVNIAYQVTGDGPRDLVLIAGFVSHLDLDWAEPRHAHFLERLGSFSRLIRFDKRGTGLSDRPGGLPDLETRMDDVRAVMDAAGSEHALVFGYSEGGPMATLFAATYPERTEALVIYGSYARRLHAADYPWGTTAEARADYAAQIESEWGWEADMERMCPNADRTMAQWWGEDRAGLLDLEVRCGVHTAEIELRGADIAGVGVHVGARVAALARPGEVWVSRTVRDLVAGSGLGFAERGAHPLKGLDEEWALYAATL